MPFIVKESIGDDVKTSRQYATAREAWEELDNRLATAEASAVGVMLARYSTAIEDCLNRDWDDVGKVPIGPGGKIVYQVKHVA